MSWPARPHVPSRDLCDVIITINCTADDHLLPAGENVGCFYHDTWLCDPCNLMIKDDFATLIKQTLYTSFSSAQRNVYASLLTCFNCHYIGVNEITAFLQYYRKLNLLANVTIWTKNVTPMDLCMMTFLKAQEYVYDDVLAQESMYDGSSVSPWRTWLCLAALEKQ